ncbi:CDP-archaeol synthase [bacterium]|nr:CDP-archaeol synthase [bacterium]
MSQETKTRVLFGFSAAALVLGILFFGNTQLVLLTCLLGASIAWHEFTQITGLNRLKVVYSTGHLIVGATIFLGSKTPLSLASLSWICLATFLAIVIEHWSADRNKSVDQAWNQWLLSVFGCFYPVFIFGFITPIVRMSGGTLWVFLGLTVVFFGDTAAYAVGRRIGKRKLWPAVSPGKTIEGAVGGVLGSLVAAALSYFLFQKFFPSVEVPLAKLLIFALLAAPMAQMGDLLESLLKRSNGAKDSGALIPGHGGILDRCDGLTFVFVFLYQLFF